MTVVSGFTKARLAVFASVLALVLGFALTAGAPQAQAAELEAGNAVFTTQSESPAIEGPSSLTIAVKEKTKFIVTDATLGQTGTWTVASSNADVVKVSPTSKSVATQAEGLATQSDTPLSLTVTAKGKSVGTANITVTFTTSKNVSSTKTIKVTVKGAKKGASAKVGAVTYKVLSNTAAAGTVTVKKAATSKKALKIPATVKINNKNYKVTGISAKAFKSAKSVKTLKVKTKKLTKASVKNSLKGSKVVVVKAPKAKVKAYTKYFAKSNSGKAVVVK